MSTERVLAWVVAILACVGSVFVYAGVPRPESTGILLVLGVLVALPLAVVFGRFLLSFRPVKRGWR
jgi:hypothetical protein